MLSLGTWDLIRVRWTWAVDKVVEVDDKLLKVVGKINEAVDIMVKAVDKSGEVVKK